MSKNPDGDIFPKMMYFDTFYDSGGRGDDKFRKQIGWVPLEVKISEEIYRELLKSPIPGVYGLDIRVLKANKKDGTVANQVVTVEYLEEAFIGDADDVLPSILPLIKQMQATSQGNPTNGSTKGASTNNKSTATAAS